MGLKKAKKKKTVPVAHQFNLFGYVRPSHKVPMDAAKVAKIRDLIAKKDATGAVKLLREINDKLLAHLSKL